MGTSDSTLIGSFSVNYSYSVHFTHGVLSADNVLLRDMIVAGRDRSSRIAFVVDEGVVLSSPGLVDSISNYCDAHLPGAFSATGVFMVPGGEGAKNDPELVDRLYAFFDGERICRHSFVVVIGAGAVLDIVGFAAATCHRGVRLIRMPTTVLSQADSGVGVKNSTNRLDKKNFVGTFAPPYAVINDALFLKTLPQREWIGGVAEAVKVALIKDRSFFEYLEDNAEAIVTRELAVMEQVIHRCAAIHVSHIATAGDPFEAGSSRPLDFGHWSAHKLEVLTNFSVRHGEAVAIGIELDTVYSCLIGLLTTSECQRVRALITRLGFESIRPAFGVFSAIELVESSLNEFREHLGGELTIALLKGIGERVDVHTIDAVTMCRAVGIVVQQSPIDVTTAEIAA